MPAGRAHGIRVIRVDLLDPAKMAYWFSKPAPMVDWNIVNRLAEKNKDFFEYISALLDFHLTEKSTKMSGVERMFFHSDRACQKLQLLAALSSFILIHESGA